MKIKSIGAFTALFLCFTLSARSLAQPAQSAQITGPEQPSSGPGGSRYSHSSVVEHTYGEGDTQYWLFEPSDPKPDSAPVVIFNHGWSAMKPGGYMAWINHIVRRGNIVIYPRYQASLTTKAAEFCNNDIHAVKDALSELGSSREHVQPQLDKLAVVGHSAGGKMSAEIAALAATSGLPPMKAVMCVEPGKSWGPKIGQIPMVDVSPMPPSTLLLAVVGDRDTVVRDIDAARIINETAKVPAQNKNLVTLVSDEHGQPPLIASHFCPAAPMADSGQRFARASSVQQQEEPAQERPLRNMLRERIMQRVKERQEQGSGSAGGGGTPMFGGVDALDYFGTWKLFDALEDAAFYGKEREFALGNTAEQRYMGKWSDGVPVKELIVEVGHADPKVQRVKIGRPPDPASFGTSSSAGQ